MHQPNVPGRGIVASYSPGFWALVVGIGVAAGLVGAVLLELLKGVERLSWSFSSGTFLAAVEASSDARRVTVLLLAGVIAGAGVLVLRRLSTAGGGEISEALWLHRELPLRASLARGALSIVTVAMGASLGREGAPQLAGAAIASRASERFGVPDWQRRLLVACGAGAGMAAVYNVPLGGAVFALEVLLGTLSLPLVLPALATSLVASAVAWIAIPDKPIYHVPAFGVSATQMVWAALIGPLAGLVAVSWVRLVGRANRLRPSGWARGVAPIVVFTLLGVLAIAYPQVLGNGQDVVQLAVLGKLSLGLLAILFVLKPLATAACLGSGSPGGLFTPTLALGVLFGGLCGHVWTLIWPGAPAGSFALIGGGAVLAAAMQGPLAAVVLVLELTRTADGLIVPLLLAIVEATVLARVLRAPSVYSARIGDTTAERVGELAIPANVPEPPPSPAPAPQPAGDPSSGA